MDFAKNHTARLRIKYIAVGKPHVMTWRHNSISGEPTTELWAQIDEFLTALEPQMFTGFTITGAEWAGRNSDVFLPVSAAALSPTPGGGAATLGDAPAFISFTGKSTQGNPAVIFLYGINIQGDTGDGANWDYRVTAVENANVANALAALQSVDNQVVAIDRTQVFWNQYCNTAYNARAQRRARRGL